MRSTLASRDGYVLVKSPSFRQQAARRRALAVCGVLALALASGAVGVLSHGGSEALRHPHTGPFSYFPSS